MGHLISKFIFYPPNPVPFQPHPDLLILTQNSIQIPVFYIKVPNPRATILFSHGTASDISENYNFLKTVAQTTQTNILLYEYLGYGWAKQLNPSLEPSEDGCYTSIDIAYEFLTLVENIDPKTIILWGYSLGSGPSCDLAARAVCGGVYIECGFLSVLNITSFNFIQSEFDFFENYNKIPSIQAPMVFIHGQKDMLIPVRHAIDMNLLAPHSLGVIVIEDGTHTNLNGEHFNIIIQGLERLLCKVM